MMKQGKEMADKAMASMHQEWTHLSDYMGLLLTAHNEFIEACQKVAHHHFAEKTLQEDIGNLLLFSQQSLDLIGPFAEKYGYQKPSEPGAMRQKLFPAMRAGGAACCATCTGFN